MNGWIKLHRKLLNNPVIMKDPETLAVWVWILLNVVHEETDVVFNGERLTLQPGQMVITYQKMAEETGVKNEKCYRIVKILKTAKQIEKRSTTKNTLITVLSWDIYQTSEKPNEKRVQNECKTSAKPSLFNKRNKEDKEYKNNIYNTRARARNMFHNFNQRDDDLNDIVYSDMRGEST